MRIVCAAIVEEPLQRENLVRCIEILSGTARVNGNVVSLEYEGDSHQIDKFISLFKQYANHEIKRI